MHAQNEPSIGESWRGEVATLSRLALPLSFSYAGVALLGVVDTAVVGRLGAEPLAAAALGNALFFAVSVLGLGLLTGLDPLFAQAFGAGDMDAIRRLLGRGVILGLMTSAVLAPALALLAVALPHLGIAGSVAEPARSFLLVRLVSLPPLLLSVVATAFLQAAGHTRPMVLALAGANLFNLGANLLLVFGGARLGVPGLGFIPALGIVGSAWATALALAVELAILAWATSNALPGASGLASLRPLVRGLSPVIRLGLPIGLQMAAEVGVFALVGVLAGRLGPGSLAGHQVALQLASLTFTFALGISKAGSVRVGWAIGARDGARARRAGLAAFLAGAGFMTACALVFLLFPVPLARLLTDQPDVVAMAAPLITIAALFQISDGIQVVGAGVLRGVGDTRVPFLINLVGHYAIGLPISIVLAFAMGRGVNGLWLGVCAGLSVVALSLFVRYLQLSKQTVAPIV